MLRTWIIGFLVLLLSTACFEPKVVYNPKDIEQCNNSCVVDSDCVVLSDTCFFHVANKRDTQCFWDKHKKFKSTIGLTIKCASPRPASDYNATCKQNTCTAALKVAQTPTERPAPPSRIELSPPPPEIIIAPKHPPFYVNSKWQFADYIDPPIEELGPDYHSGGKPFIAFNTIGEMWGHDGTVYFHRRFEFDDTSITFSPNPRFCDEGRCSDILKDLATHENRIPQTRFLGRYDMQFESDSLKFQNATHKVELKKFISPPMLPPLPKDLALCEIRDMKAGEAFPDYKPSVFEDIGYRIIGNEQTLYWDHHVGPQGYVELGDGQEVLFDGPAGPKILRRLTPYNTQASFGPQGLYCVSGGYDRHWPRFMTSDQFNITDYSPDKIDTFYPTKLSQKNYCVQLEDSKGRQFSPIFTNEQSVGYDDFGFYLKRNDKTFRIDDLLVSEIQITTVSKDAFKGFPRNVCPEPLVLIGE